MRKNPAIKANYNRDCDIGGVTVLFSAQIFSQVRNPSQVSYLVKKSMHDASRVFPPRDSQSNGFSPAVFQSHCSPTFFHPPPVSQNHCSSTFFGAQTKKPAICSENLFLSKRMKEAKKYWQTGSLYLQAFSALPISEHPLRLITTTIFVFSGGSHAY